ncbi:MAG: glutathione peroxidase [Gemmatimonadaceae bacterium]|jgi:glutathione peroxidase|nr:glutathione peroxidase [Gemmatimonadaceae bacterium]
MTTLGDYTLPAIDGGTIALDTLRGRVVLIVNVASECGFTPQYEGLEQLWRAHGAQGLTVIGCPCDQFGHQEPGSEAEIAAFCSRTYDVTFPLSAKLEVNGEGAHPLWRWLKRARPGLLGRESIMWNFTKFLIGRDGVPLDRYAPTTAPASLARDIDAALRRVT